jgi:hypothetical protein
LRERKIPKTLTQEYHLVAAARKLVVNIMNPRGCSNWQAFSAEDHPRKQMKRNSLSEFLRFKDCPELGNMKRIATMAKASSYPAARRRFGQPAFAGQPGQRP